MSKAAIAAGFATVNPSTGEERSIVVLHTGADRESRRAGRQELSIISQALSSQTSSAPCGARERLEKQQGITREGHLNGNGKNPPRG